MVVPADITMAELWRRQDRLEQDLISRARAMDDRITATAMASVPREVYDERHRALGQRIRDLEETDESLAAYRRNILIAIVASLVAAIGAVVASLLTALVH